MSRRVSEHIIWILSPDGCTQQPFYSVIRRGSRSSRMISAHLCEFVFLPLRAAPASPSARKSAERVWIRDVGTLNPPRVYSLQHVRVLKGKSSQRHGVG